MPHRPYSQKHMKLPNYDKHSALILLIRVKSLEVVDRSIEAQLQVTENEIEYL